jgi:hypothetical protein
MHLIGRAPLFRFFRAALALALTHDIELRYGVGDSDGVQGGKDNDR